MSRTSFTVGWICALTTEYVAARTFLDEEYEQTDPVLPNDNNAYTLGRIGEHYVVIAVLPNGEYGISSATSVARDMMHSFPDIRIGMMVGIGGGAPSPKHDIRLGDVVVGTPGDGKSGVFQYDFGKTVQDQEFKPTGFLNQPPASLLTAVTVLRGQYEIHGHDLQEKINLVLRKHPRLQKKYGRPDPGTDKLYQSGVVHPTHGYSSCVIACGSDSSRVIPRAERTEHEDNPAIHYGVIASADKLMKDALVRDRLSVNEDILCFEMEAAGLMNHFPCIIIRGICDYSDSHKNKEWQGYASITAAAYAKDLLRRIAPKKIELERKFSDVVSSLHEVAEEHRDIAREQLQMQKDQVERMLSKEEQECHQLFRLATGSTDATYEWYKGRVQERVEDTCLWFLKHEHFQRWLEQDSGPLLVTADPGCGKSVLAKYLIDHALPRSNTICYFFFKDQDQNTVRQALCALLHQLFSQKPLLIRYATPQFRKNGKGLTNSTESLWKILKDATNDPEAGPVILVLDALDECAESEILDLVRNVEKQFYNNQPGHGRMKYLLTSRPYEHIVSEFYHLLDKFPKVRIPGEEESETISQEVDHVITYRINQLSKRKRLSTELKSHLMQRLRQTTHRTYLWIYLVFEYLEEEDFKKTQKGVEAIIVTLPNSVNEAYEQILSKSKEHPMVRKVLSIILAASRPLTLSEMNIAVNVSFDSQSFLDIDMEDEEDFRSRLRSWCGLFVSIHHDRIYFLHQTAREFLLADLAPTTATPEGLRWYHSITARQAHTVLTEVCVICLNLSYSNSFLLRDPLGEVDFILEVNTFFTYSAENWSDHFRKADITGEAAIMLFVLKLCDPDSKTFPVWFTIYWESRRIEVLKRVGRTKVWRRYTDCPRNLTDLMVASYLGHLGIVKVLVEGGAKIDQKDIKGWTALSWAVEEAHLDVVELLLRAGAAINCKYNTLYEEQGGYMLQRNISGENHRSGHEGGRHFCHYILGNIVFSSALEQCVHTPLSRAAEEGYEAVIQLLTKTSEADFDWEDVINWIPLSWAIDGGHLKVVKLLLGAGTTVLYEYIFPDEAGRKCATTPPLSLAAENGL